MKKIQISEELFIKLVKYHLLDMPELQDEIARDLEQKLDAMKRHELYTQSKTADTEEKKEEARQKYLDEVGMLQSFRW